MILATVISSDKLRKHNVDKYNFKVFAVGATADTKDEAQSSSLTEEYSSENNPKRRDSDIDSSAMSVNSKDALIESLMKKTDEMSSNFIKLQMKLESKEQEHKQELEKAKLDSFNEGVEAGKAQALKNSEEDYVKGLTQFSNSVATLEERAKDYERALEGIKSELITAALDISQEVVSVELANSSQKIAKVLGDELIKELQSASKITLRVNPKDHGSISEHVGSLKHVEIISDAAVSEGGVVAISDAGNIDAQISKRFERVKRAALSE